MDSFIVNALVAGTAVALVAGPLGSIVVWRRLAFFGDTLSHAALLGVAASLLLEVEPIIGVSVTGVAVAVMLSTLSSRTTIATDTLLSIVSHSTLAVGVIAVSVRDDLRVDLMSYLFGDILAVGRGDLVQILIACALALLTLLVSWRTSLAVTVNEDMAQAEGLNPAKARLLLLVTLALVVATAVKVVGLLLITALLVIPAAAARANANTPESMAFWASCFAVASLGLGMYGSFQVDSPTGPSIVAAAAALCAAAFLVRKIRGKSD